MKEWGNFPIKEMLLGKEKLERYVLKIDSIMQEVFTDEYVKEWAKYKQEVDAPYNTLSSGAEPDLFATDTESEGEKKLTKEEMEDPELARKAFDVNLLKTNPFRPDSLKYFPYKVGKEGEIPWKLLRVPKLDFVAKSQELLKEQ